MGLGPFSTREIAIGLWTAGFVVWVSTYPTVRRSFWHVVRTALNWKLLVPFLAAALYTGLAAWLLKQVDIWTPDLLKDTVFWFIFAGVALAFSGLHANKELRWRDVVVDQVKVVVLVEYVVNTYTFSLPVELLLVPALAIVALLSAVAQTDNKYSAIVKLANWVQGLFGVAVLGFAVSEALRDWAQFSPVDALRSLILSPLLSLLILPFVYAFALVSAYELLFLKLKLGQPKDPVVVRETKRKLFKHLGLRLRGVQAFTSEHALELIRLKSPDDVDKMLAVRSSLREPGR
jgi:hypothetical protein